MGEQILYQKEGIPFDALDFPDNQESLQLIEGKPFGIFVMLDEECKLMKGSDKSLNGKLHKQFEKHPKFKIIRQKPDVFVVHHFAGPVEYLSTGFVDKNKDALRVDLVECCYASENPNVVELFQEVKD